MTVAQQAHPPADTSFWLPKAAVIDRIRPETSGVWTYDLRIVDREARAKYRFRPGQFNMLYLPGIGEIPISPSGDPAIRRACAHTIRAAGNVTRALSRLGVGGRLGLRGPFGTAWPLAETRGADVLVVAGGIGLAPLRPVICHVLAHRKRFGRVAVLYGARQPAYLLFAQEFDSWRQRGIEVEVTVDRGDQGWQGNIGVVPSLLDRWSGNRPTNTVLFGCGPEVMMKYVVRSALERGLSVDRIWLSLERNMQCAVGLCGHCQLGPLFVCRDGPVCRYDRIEGLWNVELL